MIMQISLDDRAARSIQRLVEYIGQNAITWVVVFAAAVVLILLVTKKRR